MKWTRHVLNNIPSFGKLSLQVETIESTVVSNPALCIETCKSLIESLCKSILTNQGITINDDLKFQALVKKTVDALIQKSGVLIPDLSELARRIASVGQCIAEIRNDAGFASHGLDINHPQITDTLSLFMYKITDVICGFILQFYLDYARKSDTRIIYEDCNMFNDWFDDQYPLSLGGVVISASEALYKQDYEAYKINFNDFVENGFMEELSEAEDLATGNSIAV